MPEYMKGKTMTIKTENNAPYGSDTQKDMLGNLESMMKTILIFHENLGETIEDEDHIYEGYAEYSDEYDWHTLLELLSLDSPRITSTIHLNKIAEDSIFDHIDKITILCTYGGPNIYLSIFQNAGSDEPEWKFEGYWGGESLIIKGNYKIAEAINKDMNEINEALIAFGNYILGMVQEYK